MEEAVLCQMENYFQQISRAQRAQQIQVHQTISMHHNTAIAEKVERRLGEPKKPNQARWSIRAARVP